MENLDRSVRTWAVFFSPGTPWWIEKLSREALYIFIGGGFQLTPCQGVCTFLNSAVGESLTSILLQTGLVVFSNSALKQIIHKFQFCVYTPLRMLTDFCRWWLYVRLPTESPNFTMSDSDTDKFYERAAFGGPWTNSILIVWTQVLRLTTVTILITWTKQRPHLTKMSPLSWGAKA